MIIFQRLRKLLKSFLTSKRIELENLQVNLKSEHVNKVNNLLVTERNNMRNIQKQSNEILQQDYLLMKANMLMTSAMEAKFQQLYKAYDGNRVVTFSEENLGHQNYDVEDDNKDMILKAEDTNSDDDNMDCDDNNEAFAIPTGPKVRRALHPEMVNGNGFTLDVTHVIGQHGTAMDDDCQPLSGANSTFLLSAKPTRPVFTSKKASAVSRVLKDTNPNISKDAGLTKGMLSSRNL